MIHKHVACGLHSLGPSAVFHRVQCAFNRPFAGVKQRADVGFVWRSRQYPSLAVISLLFRQQTYSL